MDAGLSGLTGNQPCYTNDSQVEASQHAIVYRTAPLASSLYINGPIEADVWMAATNAQAALAVRLDDVDPSGNATPLTTGIQSAVYRAVDTAVAVHRRRHDSAVAPLHGRFDASARPRCPGARRGRGISGGRAPQARPRAAVGRQREQPSGRILAVAAANRRRWERDESTATHASFERRAAGRACQRVALASRRGLHSRPVPTGDPALFRDLPPRCAATRRPSRSPRRPGASPQSRGHRDEHGHR